MKRKVIYILILTVFVVGAILFASAPTLAREKPVPGGTLRISNTTDLRNFGYPPNITGGDRNVAHPFFNRLLTVGEGGIYQPELATSWKTSSDGRNITFKLRQGVKFHDGTEFNAQAVKSNIDALLPPNPSSIQGIDSVEVVDPYTLRINLSSYSNLILYQIASNYEFFMYSPTALRKNGVDWAMKNPVGTGPFKFVSYEHGQPMRLVKNPNYWVKGLPYIDAIEITWISDQMTQMLSLKARQLDILYDTQPETAAQLRDAGYTVVIAPGSYFFLSLDLKNNKLLADKRIREAIEYAIDKEGICKGPGLDIYKPIYQIVSERSPYYNKACPPRKYDLKKARQLLTEAGYPDGFTLKAFFQNTYWRVGLNALQASLAKAEIKLDINYITNTAYTPLRVQGLIEPGSASQMTTSVYGNNLLTLDYFWRNDSPEHPYVIRPVGSSELIDKAKSAKNVAATTKLAKEVVKLNYDELVAIPVWMTQRIAVMDKSVQDIGYFINGDQLNNRYDKVWLKK